MGVHKIISGGQSGVDRAALDAAGAMNIACGGWCPKDRWAEDGRIDDRYPLRETESADPSQRTRLNVRDSDGTLIIARRPLSGGTALTERIAEELGRPCLVIGPSEAGAAEAARGWIVRCDIAILNVAGPRESQSPGIHEKTRRLLEMVLGGTGADRLTAFYNPPMPEQGRQGFRADDSNPQALRAAIEAAVDYRGDVSVSRRSSPEPVTGFGFDCSADLLRLLPADGSARIAIPLDDIAAIEFTGKDAAEGRSFETWVKKYVQKKLAGEPANIEPDQEDAP